MCLGHPTVSSRHLTVRFTLKGAPWPCQQENSCQLPEAAGHLSAVLTGSTLTPARYWGDKRPFYFSTDELSKASGKTYFVVPGELWESMLSFPVTYKMRGSHLIYLYLELLGRKKKSNIAELIMT